MGGEYRQLFEAVPENGTATIPRSVSKFMGLTTVVVQHPGGQQYPQEIRFDIQAFGLRDAWSKFTACETEAIAKLMRPSLVMPGEGA
jgi:hypothetical protein